LHRQPFANLPEGDPLSSETFLKSEAVGLDPLDVGARIEELKQLQPGWLDGEGVPLPHAGLEWLRTAFDQFYSSDLPLPYLFPTLTGDALAEWSLKPWSPSLEIDLVQHRGKWHALNLETDEEKTEEIDLTDIRGWDWLGAQLRTIAGRTG